MSARVLMVQGCTSDAGKSTVVAALCRWLRRRGSHPADLLELARHWPRTLAPLGTALDVLL